MQIAILDFETTGKDPLTCIPIQLAASILHYNESSPWWVESGDQFGFNEYILDRELKEISPEIEELTGISFEKLQKEGLPTEQVIAKFLKVTQDCRYFLAHNMEYDSLVLANAITHYPDLREMFQTHPAYHTENWICTYKDVPYAAKYRCKILSHLALDHGVMIQEGEKLHDAMTDIELLRRMLRVGGYSLDAILKYRAEPWIYIKAGVMAPWEDGGISSKAARAEGFTWEGFPGVDEPRFPKSWVKRVKESKFEAEKLKKVSFPRTIIKE